MLPFFSRNLTKTQTFIPLAVYFPLTGIQAFQRHLAVPAVVLQLCLQFSSKLFTTGRMCLFTYYSQHFTIASGSARSYFWIICYKCLSKMNPSCSFWTASRSFVYVVVLPAGEITLSNSKKLTVIYYVIGTLLNGFLSSMKKLPFLQAYFAHLQRISLLSIYSICKTVPGNLTNSTVEKDQGILMLMGVIFA